MIYELTVSILTSEDNKYTAYVYNEKECTVHFVTCSCDTFEQAVNYTLDTISECDWLPVVKINSDKSIESIKESAIVTLDYFSFRDEFGKEKEKENVQRSFTA